MDHQRRIADEVEHGRRLLEHPPRTWSWGTPAGQRREQRRARLLCEHGRFQPGQKLLELGCGVGNITARVVQSTGAAVVAVDVSPDLIAEARRRVSQAGFEIVDAHRLPFAAASFDAVYGSSVLHHLDLAPALAEIRRVLRPGGRVVFAEPNMLNPQVFLTKHLGALKRLAHETPHETAFVRWRLARALAAAGFDEVRVAPFDFLHPFVPGPLVEWVDRAGRTLERIPLLREIAGSCLISGEKPAGAAP